MENSTGLSYMTCRYKTKLVFFFCLFMIFTIFLLQPADGNSQGFTHAAIEKPFKKFLMAHPDLAVTSGARVIQIDQNRLALIGVSQVSPAKNGPEDLQTLIRIGAIKARANILKFSLGVEVFTYRGSTQKNKLGNKASNSITLSAFFQVTEEAVSGEIEQLPVIGSWWDENHGIFQVAVGTVKNTNELSETFPQKYVENNSSFSYQSPKIKIKGETPYVNLLKAASVLRDNGGVRLFLINNQKHVIMAVASARIFSSRAQAERVARIKAIRKLLAHKNGVALSSVKYLADGEVMRITDEKAERVMLFDYLSIQEESVSGFISALPVVAKWTTSNGNSLRICIGKLIQ